MALQIQKMSQSKINCVSLSLLRDYLLNVNKTAVPVTSNYLYRYHKDSMSVAKQQNVQSSYPIHKYASIYCCANNINSLQQRREFRISNHNRNFEGLFQFASQANVGLKLKEPQGNENTAMNSDFDGDLPNRSQGESSSREGRPSLEQLEKIKETLSYDLPRFFFHIMDYKIYNPDIVFINNVKGISTKGFFMYYLQMSLLRIIGHLKFIYVKFHVLKITTNPEDDSVKVRWRVSGISQMKIFSRFFAFKNPFKVKETIQREQESWIDGFSTFYVNKDGKVYKHIADKMMPSNEEIEEKKLKLPVKMAICSGISNLDFLLSDIFTKM